MGDRVAVPERKAETMTEVEYVHKTLVYVQARVIAWAGTTGTGTVDANVGDPKVGIADGAT